VSFQWDSSDGTDGRNGLRTLEGALVRWLLAGSMVTKARHIELAKEWQDKLSAKSAKLAKLAKLHK
jgi:hypothetical protein